MDICKLTSASIDDILNLQEKSYKLGDIFIPSSRELYERAFQFKNFVFGIYTETNELIAFCNCSIPTHKAKKNLGRGIVDDSVLDLVGHVNTIIVKHEYRRRGIGREILQSVIQEFRKAQIRYLFVMISPKNTASLSLFRSSEFKLFQQIEYAGEDRYILRLDI